MKAIFINGSYPCGNDYYLSLRERLLHAIFGLRHYVSPEITFAKSCKWQNKMNFICTFGIFVVILQAKL